MPTTRLWRIALSTVLLVVSTSGFAQVPGQNINMVSGTTWPAGDPFLQRQNEPSMAVSTRNPQHLLAGANDYRSVDIANPAAPNELGDAWLGVFTSTDGGDTWSSTLLPGYPQDTSAVGKASPLHAFTTATDPTVRAGSNGLFYYSGLAFDRGTQMPSGVFVSVFQDQNNKGNGNGAIQSAKGGNGNPFQYINTTLITSGTSGQFLDKPWLAVDIPRSGRTATCTVNGQKFSSGYVYLFYTIFTGVQNNPHSAINVSTSTNCGVTWSAPQVVSQSSKYNQGAIATIDPSNGNVWVAWRQRSLGNMAQPDAILYAYSTNGGISYNGPFAAYTFPTGQAFDQSASSLSFRTIDVPAIAVDNNSRVWVAFSKRMTGPGGTGASRIMISSLPKGSSTWTTPYQADSSSPTNSVYAHQFMPAFSYAYGKLMLAWYDTRWDNQQIVVNCTPNSSQTPSCTQTHVPIPGSPLASNPPNYAAVFTSQVLDPTGQVRHTVDVFGAIIDPSQAGKSVPAVQISQYPFFINVTNPNSPVIQQATFNPPNLPEFVQGTIAFIGDYIDIAGLSMVPSGATWKFTDATTSPVFHTTWTDNRDVIPPPYVNGIENWGQYSPPGATAAAPSIYNPLASESDCAAGYSGDRNENIYTSRITSGLVVGFHENQKAITTSNLQRAFSLYVRNTNNPLTNPNATYYRILLGTTTAGANGTTCSNTVTGGTASFPGVAGCYEDIAVLPTTSVAQTIVVTANSSANTNIGVNVLVIQIAGPGGNPNGGPQAIALVNGDPTNPSVVNPDNTASNPSNPDYANLYSNLPNLLSGEAYDPSGVAGADLQTCDPSNPNYPSCEQTSTLVAAPSIAAPSIAAPSIAAPSIAAPSIAAPSIAAPSIAAPSITAVTTAAPSIVNPTTAAPSIAAPSIAAPSIVNFATAAPSITNLPDSTVVTDYSWKVNNKSNTTTSYNTQQFIRQASTYCGTNGTRCQLIAHKTYASPTVGLNSNGQSSCQLAVAVADITQANIPDPAFTTASGLGGANGAATINAGSASISLAPGEGTRLTLRVFAPQENPIPVIPGTNVFPITPIASATTPDTGQTTPPQSLTILTAVLPVAVVGQPYTSTGLGTGGQVKLQSLGGVFPLQGNVQTTPVWSLENTANPAPVGVPGGPYPLPVSPLTLAQSGNISTDVVTAGPSIYSFTPQVQDYASPNQNLDAQFLNLQVNQFSITNVDAVTVHNGVPNTVGSTGFMQAGDTATVKVTVLNQGPSGGAAVPETNVAVALSVNAVAGGSTGGPIPVITAPCVKNSTNPVASLAGGSSVEFDFICTAISGNGYVNFTANAQGFFVNGAGTVTANAIPVTTPPSLNGTPPNVVVDSVKPTLNYLATTSVQSAPGWYNTPVVVPFTTNDNLSGVQTAVATPPATSAGTSAAFNGTGSMTLTTEGNAVMGVMTVTDFAFNSASFTSIGYAIDKTNPNIVGAATPAANGSGWNNTPVTVAFTCVDPNPLNGPAGQQSGIFKCSPHSILSLDGKSQSATGTAVDNAANPASTTVTGINIDQTPPTIFATTSSSTPVNGASWYNHPVTVSFACNDPAPANWAPGSVQQVSGLAACTASSATGACGGSLTASSCLLSSDGSSQSVAGSVSDVAGNPNGTAVTGINIDQTPPVIATPAATANGNPYSAGTWTNQDVTVTFSCSDNLSGPLPNNPVITGLPPLVTPSYQVNGLTTTATVVLTAETSLSGVTLTANCQDVAGNSATAQSFGPVLIDKTPPVVTGSANLSSSNGPAYTAGSWTNQSVVVTFACADPLSGVKPGSIMGSNTYASQGTYTANGSCQDIAGNTGTGSFGPIMIDTTTPAVLITSPSAQTYVLNQQITPNFTCGDASGGDLVTCTTNPAGSPYTASAVGPASFSVHAVDQAGNILTPDPSVNYLVIYNFTGFQTPLQPAVMMNPVNPPKPPQPSDSGSFTVGSAIPIAWQLQDATNTYISDLTTLTSILAFPNATCSGPATGTGTTLYNATTGQSAFSYDTPNNRFVFNWDTTPFAPGCYNLVVTTNDTAQWSTIVHLAAEQFNGFDAPLTTASAPANPSNSGTFDMGSTIPVMFQLFTPGVGYDSGQNVSLSNLTAYANSSCSGAPPAGSQSAVLYDLASSTGSVNFQSDIAIYTVSWNTASFAAGCYNLVATLSDQSVYATMVTLAPAGGTTTLLQYNFDNVAKGTQTAPASFAAPNVSGGVFGFSVNNPNGVADNGCVIGDCIDPVAVSSGQYYSFSITNTTNLSNASLSFREFNNDCQNGGIPSCNSAQSFTIQYDTDPAFSNPTTLASYTPPAPGFTSYTFPIGTLAAHTYYFQITATGNYAVATAQYVLDNVTVNGSH